MASITYHSADISAYNDPNDTPSKQVHCLRPKIVCVRRVEGTDEADVSMVGMEESLEIQ